MATSLQLIPLMEDTVCPYCQTTVKEGACVCPSCHAEHGRKRVTLFHYVVGLSTAFCLVAALIFIVCSILSAILGLRGGGESFLYILGVIATLVVGGGVVRKGRKRLDALGSPNWWR